MRSGKPVVLWIATIVLLLTAAAVPALSTIFAPAGSVITKSLVKNAVTSAKIRNGTIKNADIAAGAAIAASKINLAGMVTVGGLAYKTPKTGYFAIASTVLQPLGTSAQYTKNGNYVYPNGNGFVFFVAPVNLPQGSTVTEVRFKVFDNSPTYDIKAWMYRSNSTGVSSEMVSTSTAGQPGVWQSITDNSIVNPVIDNSTYGYAIWLRTQGEAGGAQRISLVTVVYTYTSAGD